MKKYKFRINLTLQRTINYLLSQGATAVSGKVPLRSKLKLTKLLVIFTIVLSWSREVLFKFLC